MPGKMPPWLKGAPNVQVAGKKTVVTKKASKVKKAGGGKKPRY